MSEGFIVKIGADNSEALKKIAQVGDFSKQLGRELTKIGRDLTATISLPFAAMQTAAFISSQETVDIFTRFHDKLRVSFANFGTELSRAIGLETFLTGIANGFTTLTNGFAQLSGPLKTTIGLFVEFFTFLGPGIIVFGELVKGIEGISKAIVLLNVGLTFLKANPIVLLATAILGAATAFGLLETFASGAGEKVKDVGEDFQTAEGKISAAKKRLDELSRVNIEDVKDKVKALKDEIAKLESQRDTILQAIAGSNAPQQIKNLALQGSALRVLNTAIAARTAALKEQENILNGTTEAEQRNIITTEEARKIDKDVVLNQQVLNKEWRLGASLVDQNTERLKVLTEARRKLLQGLPISDPLVQRYTKAINDLTVANITGNSAQQKAIDLAVARDKLQTLGGGVNTVQVELDRELDTRKQILSVLEDPSRNLPAEQIAALNTELQKTQTNISSLSSPMSTFVGLCQAVPPLAQQIGQLMFDTVQSFSQGVGQAVAQALVYQQNLGKLGLALLKQVAAQIIATLISLGVAELLYTILGIGRAAATASANIAGSAGRAGAAAVAASVETLGLAGIAAAPAFAAAAIAAATAAGTAGITAGMGIGQTVHAAAEFTAYESGGIGLHPQISTFAEGGPEIALTRANVREFLGMDGPLQANLYVDGDLFATAMFKRGPSVLRTMGVTT